MRQERDALLWQLGLMVGGEGWTRIMVELDHRPPLWVREKVGEEYSPAENDPKHMEFVLKADHKIRTHGTKATTAGSDAGNRAKVKRLILKCSGRPPKPKRVWASRPFPKRRRP